MVNPAQYQFFNTLQAMTREGWLTRDLIDTVFKDGKIFKWLRSMGHVLPIDGGIAQLWNLNIGTSPNTMAFDGLNPLNLFSMDNNAINAALQTKRYTDALIMPISTIQDNDGTEAAVGNIVRTQLQVVKASLVKKLSTDAIVNTTAINSLQLNGLAEAIDNGTVAASYAGVNRTTYPAAVSGQVNYNSVMSALLTTIQNLDLAASVDGERPSAYFGTNGIFGGLQNLLQNFNQYQDGAILQKNAIGYDLVVFGKPFFIDQYLPTGVAVPAGVTPPAGTNAGGYMYGLNGSYCKLFVNRRWNFRASDWDSAEATVAAIFSRLYWSGNLAILKPSTCWGAWVQGG